MPLPASIHELVAELGFATLRTKRQRARPTIRRPHPARPRVEGLEDRCLLSITEFPVTSGGNLYSIAAGSDGNLWFTQLGANIGKINPTTDEIAQFQTPTANSEPFGDHRGSGRKPLVHRAHGRPNR